MNKVIGGKRYDTDNAERIGETDNGTYPGDLDYYCETLYQKKRTKEYFLHLEGGARSQVAHRDGSGWVGGDVIEPLSQEAAKAWAETNMDADEYEAAFGAVLEAAPLYLKGISAEAQAKLAHEAAMTGKTKSQIVEELLEAL